MAWKVPNSDGSLPCIPSHGLSPNYALIRELFGIWLLPTSVGLSLPRSLSARM